MTAEEKCRYLVSVFFKKEPHKAKLWFRTKNINLGYVTPNWMIKTGRVKKLLQFIEWQIYSGQPPKPLSKKVKNED